MAERDGVPEVTAPSGTVTFLFSDIEGSTPRWTRDRAAMQEAVRRHDHLMREAIALNGGHVFKTIGDAFCVAFATPESAALAALDAQRRLNGADFSAVDGLRVRMAINTGTADERDGDYFGPALNRVARLVELGHGGQVLLSDAAAVLIRDDLPPQASLVDLGAHALRGIDELERVYQLVAPELRSDFPTLRAERAPQPWLVPMTMRTRYFTGRNDLLARLRQQLVERHRAALSGLGGVGKTQTAIEYATRHRAAYPSGVFWVNAETTSGLTGGFVEIAAALGLPAAASNDQETVVKAVMKWLNGTSGWLLVLDNVDDRRTIQAFVPEDAEGHVLMTSREPIFAEVGIPRALEVRDLDGDEAVSFLLARTGREDAEPDDRAAAAELAAELGCLPLALEQAAAYTSETSAAFSVYLSAFRKRRVTLLEKSGGLVAHDSVAVTWRANFEAVERESAAAADVLRMSALLAPDAIPFKLFLDGSHVLGEPIAEALTDSDDLAMTEVLRPLARYSLIRSDATSRTFSVHRLVQDIVWEAVAESDRSALVERAVHALDAAFPSVEYANWQQCERLTAHIFSIAAWLQSYAAAPESAIRVLNRAGHYLRERGRSAEAQRLHERALAIAERAFGPEHRESATSLNYLASVYWDQALYGEARRIAERALRILERELGTDHPDVARSLNTLGLIHHEQGHYAEATPLHERAMVIRERAFGPDHADVARSRTNLAHVKLAQGRYREAHALYELSLKTWERAFGPDHPAISTALTNLGNVHYDSGRFAEALSLFERSLTISERTLGPDDPDLAIGLSNLASALIQQGRHSEALPLNERALTIWERTLGPDHPSLAFSLNGLAEAERHLGRYAEAEALFKRALTIRERVLGADHPDLSEGLTGLANLYAHIGRTGDAAALYQRALDIQERALGSNHPKVADTLVGLAAFRTESALSSDALALYERALAIKESTFGDDDEQVVAIRDAIDALRSTM